MALSHLSTNERSYYSLINKTAIDIAKKLLSEKYGIFEIKLDEKQTKETIKQMMDIYPSKETDKNEYKNWDGKIPYDHPVVKQFKETIINTLEENKLDDQYLDFETRFDIQFNNEIKQSSIFTRYQKEKELENRSDKRSKYYSWILKDLDKPNLIDDKKATEYYIRNRAIELDIKDKLNHKDNWNLLYHEAESLYDKDKEWKLEGFLNSDDIIKVVAAPFGTGKTSFAKDATQKMIIKPKEMKLNDTWIPMYISLKSNLVSEYKSVNFYHELNNVIKPVEENVLLICDGLDEYSNAENIERLIDDLLNVGLKLKPGLSIATLKIILTTRPEAGFPGKLGIDMYLDYYLFLQIK